MLDFFLARARKEPHYRIYFWPSLDLTLGRTFFDPTVMPRKFGLPPNHLQVYGFSRIRQAPGQNIFGPLAFGPVQSPGPCAKQQIPGLSVLDVPLNQKLQ